LNLGAVTPQEIAVSILAELIGVKYGKIDTDASDTGDRRAQSPRWSPNSATEVTIGG
jgi:xanthine/CO dehydrogenase XdhC/CoxF family maturation factor